MKRFLLTGLLALAVCACEEPPRKFGEAAPFSVRVLRERNYYEALRQAERLEGMGLSPYLIGHELPEGRFYEVLLSARADYEEMLEERMRYEDERLLTGLEIVNFNKLREELAVASPDRAGERRVEANKPFLPERVYDLLRKFPVGEGLKLRQALLVHSPQGFSANNLYHVVNAAHDLPRGLDLPALLPKTETFAEARYYDPLFDKSLTVEIMRLSEDYTDTEDNLDVPRVFADQILGTREYETEESERLEIDAWQALKGYALTITPRRNSKRHYFVLRSASGNFLLFFQSADYTPEEMAEIAEGCGGGGGLEQFDSFHNCFFTLPERSAFDDRLVFFKMEERMPEDGRIDALTGTLSAEFTFQTPSLGVWGYDLEDMLSPQAAEGRLERAVKAARSQAGRGALADTSRIAGSDAYGFFQVAEDGAWQAKRLAFQKGRYLLTLKAVDAQATRQDFRSRAESLQLGR